MAGVSRRTLILALPALAVAGRSFAAAPIYRVSGTVTAKNYKGLESFLFNSLDKVVGFSLKFPINKDAGEGELTAYVDEDALFISYLREMPSESQISAQDGYVLHPNSITIDGFFSVTAEGMHQGITPLVLSEAKAAPGAKITDLDINRLKASIRK